MNEQTNTQEVNQAITKKICLLTVTFYTQIPAEELVGFRGAIVAKVRREYE